jgi:hypothetical protein
MSDWISIDDRLPDPSVWVLGWVYLPKNPIASSHSLVQYSGCREDEPEGMGEFRRTVGCWWGNGRYYPKGYVTHWMELPDAPKVNK